MVRLFCRFWSWSPWSDGVDGDRAALVALYNATDVVKLRLDNHLSCMVNIPHLSPIRVILFFKISCRVKLRIDNIFPFLIYIPPLATNSHRS